MAVVGLTGGIGSGKSEAARVFTKLGVPVVDVDTIARQLTSKGQATLITIVATFGLEFLNEDGTLNRAMVRDKVFSDDEARLQLEAILHPAIYDQSVIELDKNKDAPYQVIAVPLLFESDRYQSIISKSLLIDCDETLQVARVVQRNKMTEPEVRAIMSKQMSRDARIELADEVIVNEGTIAELDAFIQEFNQKMLSDLHS